MAYKAPVRDLTFILNEVLEILLALGMLMPLFSWRIGRWPLLVSAAALVVLEIVMLGVHIVGADISLAVTNLVLLAITIPVLLGRRPSC